MISSSVCTCSANPTNSTSLQLSNTPLASTGVDSSCCESATNSSSVSSVTTRTPTAVVSYVSSAVASPFDSSSVDYLVLTATTVNFCISPNKKSVSSLSTCSYYPYFFVTIRKAFTCALKSCAFYNNEIS